MSTFLKSVSSNWLLERVCCWFVIKCFLIFNLLIHSIGFMCSGNRRFLPFLVS
jgi:hypothetical protein